MFLIMRHERDTVVIARTLHYEIKLPYEGMRTGLKTDCYLQE
jgi:hypothetical protein